MGAWDSLVSERDQAIEIGAKAIRGLAEANAEIERLYADLAARDAVIEAARKVMHEVAVAHRTPAYVTALYRLDAKTRGADRDRCEGADDLMANATNEYTLTNRLWLLPTMTRSARRFWLHCSPGSRSRPQRETTRSVARRSWRGGIRPASVRRLSDRKNKMRSGSS